MLCSLLLLAAGDLVVVSDFQSPFFIAFDPSLPIDGTFYGTPFLTGPLGTTIGPDGLLYVADEITNRVLRFQPWDGLYIDAFVEDDPGTAVDETGGLDGPSSVVFGPDRRLYVGSFNGDAVLAYDGRTGAFDGVFVAPSDGNLDGPDSGMVFGSDGNLYVPSYFSRRVKRYEGVTGAFIDNAASPIGSGLRNPRSVVFPGDGSLLVTSEGSDEVLRFDGANGAFQGVFIGDDPATAVDESGGLDGPTGIARAADGSWWVGSVNTGDIKRYAADGTYLETRVSGGLTAPVHVTIFPVAEIECFGLANSVGAGASLVARGSTSVAANDFRLELNDAPSQQLAVFVQGDAGTPAMAGDGQLCIGAPFFRFASSSTSLAGTAEARLDLSQPAVPAAAITAGSTWRFQAGYRDALGPGGTGFNLSSSVAVRFTP
ncbi:MAG: hypothetical protein AAGA20_19295 [Planctomycetota bacterium]